MGRSVPVSGTHDSHLIDRFEAGEFALQVADAASATDAGDGEPGCSVEHPLGADGDLVRFQDGADGGEADRGCFVYRDVESFPVVGKFDVARILAGFLSAGSLGAAGEFELTTQSVHDFRGGFGGDAYDREGDAGGGGFGLVTAGEGCGGQEDAEAEGKKQGVSHGVCSEMRVKDVEAEG